MTVDHQTNAVLTAFCVCILYKIRNGISGHYDITFVTVCRRRFDRFQSSGTHAPYCFLPFFCITQEYILGSCFKTDLGSLIALLFHILLCHAVKHQDQIISGCLVGHYLAQIFFRIQKELLRHKLNSNRGDRRIDKPGHSPDTGFQRFIRHKQRIGIFRQRDQPHTQFCSYTKCSLAPHDQVFQVVS